MKPRQRSKNQGSLLGADLLEHLNPQNPLMILGRKMPWDFLENELTPLYARERSSGQADPPDVRIVDIEAAGESE